MRKLLGILLIACVMCGLPAPSFTYAKTVDELRSELQEKRDALKDTESKIEEFKKNIQVKKQEARTLADQIAIFDTDIEALELEIARTEKAIEKTEAEIAEVEEEIRLKEEEISYQKEILSEYIRQLYTLDQQSTVSILLKYQTFSEAMSEASTIQELQNRAHETLVAIQQLRDDLLIKQRELEDFKQSLVSLRDREQKQQDILQSQRGSKNRILELTNAQESQYRSLLVEAQRSQQSAEATIKELDAKIREELKRQGIGNLPSVGTLSWPIDPEFGISCAFHCAGYPYAYLIGQHSGIDIPTHVGTPIKAPADGYVARAHDSGGTGYSYILVIHGDNISTVYGHVSGFAAREGQLVTRGTVIGYTGGAAGSRGSGLSSGPHLHFEVRQNNIPVNPMNFLN